ncbi:MBL fold metallo-hydrolase [Tepidamorphus sp. 3E244]|uniref:MBL fold metallo-hydrolase n=1 Tax=Tepidamorphus sp. 3E244 TaxID=3385498 RepID=UPI0038FD1DD2
MRYLSSLIFGLAVFCTAATARAQGQLPDSEEPISQCLAIARGLGGVQYASLTPVAMEPGDVTITFVGHSTFRIETAGGVVIATDFDGRTGEGRTPDVVTMNRAHHTHYTLSPDPAIPHVLRGWGEGGEPARHRMKLEDVYIRNVTTDIRGGFEVGAMADGNSIFIFEVAGLCIGHLGHLHHELSASQRAKIGRLDVVMVPVDGSYTMAQGEMIGVLQDLRASIVLPMHFFGSYTLERFVEGMKDGFRVEYSDTPTITVSLRDLPDTPAVIVLPGY